MSSKYWLGKKRSEETINKIRAKLKGRPCPHLRKEKIEKKCLFCRKEFLVIPARKDKAKFCSISCNSKNTHALGKIKYGRQVGYKHRKETIEKLIKNHNPKSNLNLKYRPPKGAKPWNKGLGTTATLAMKIRNLNKYRDWRSAIQKRDNYTCCLCGKIGGIIHVDHHPKTFASILRENNINSVFEADNCPLLWDNNNGRVLCVHCHNNKSKKQKIRK